MIYVEKNVIVNEIGLAILIKTQHGDMTAMTAIHTRQHPWRQGGVRFAVNANEIELAHLALGMTEKALAADIPIDGMKCLVVCPGGVPAAAQDRAKILADHIKLVKEVEPNAVFGPDMNCQEDVLDIVYADHGLKKSVTGLSKHNGGLEIDKNGFTAIGVFEAIETATELMANNLSTASIQGFGAVGAHLAGLLQLANYSVVAISNIDGCLAALNGELDVVASSPENCGRTFRDFDQLKTTYQEIGHVFFDARPERLFNCRADIVTLAARTSVLARENELSNARKENKDVVAVEAMYEAVRPMLIVEAANHPLSEAAERFLSDRDVVILPDILINCGGMIGCWYEYKHRETLITKNTTFDHALERCLDYTRNIIKKNVRELLVNKFETKDFERAAVNKLIASRRGQIGVSNTDFIK